MRIVLLKLLTIIGIAAITQQTFAQCNNNSKLGAPIPGSVDFGSGDANIGPPLPADQTPLTYIADQCTGDLGSYTIVKKVNCEAYAGGWHVVPSDNGGNGYAMLINSKLGLQFQKKISVCPHTTYQYSIAVLNMVQKKASDEADFDIPNPSIKVVVETVAGQELGSFQALEIQPLNEPKFTTFPLQPTSFTVNDETEIVIKVISLKDDGLANDFVIDDILIKPCIPIVDAQINGYNGPICENYKTSFTLQAVLNNQYPVFLWQENINSEGWHDLPGSKNVNNYSIEFNKRAAGKYAYRFVMAYSDNLLSDCNVQGDPMFVTVNALPKVSVPARKAIFEGESVVLDATLLAGGDQTVFSWSPSEDLNQTNALQPRAKPTKDVTYTLTATNSCGQDEASVFVRVYQKITTINTFTPNGDMVNDTWHVKALNTYPEAIIDIFNRYGQQVFHSKGYSKEWDGNYNGSPLPSGTYYYIINLNNDTPKQTGYVTILR